MNVRQRHRTSFLAAALLAFALPWGVPCAGGQETRPEAGGTAGPPTARPGADDDKAGKPLPPRSSSDIEARRVGRKATSDGGWWKTLGALAVVVAAIFVVRIVLRRLAGTGGMHRHGQPIEVLARATIGARQQVALVRLGRRLVLVGSGPSGMSPLAEVSDPQEVADLLEQVRVGGVGGLGGWAGGMDALTGVLGRRGRRPLNEDEQRATADGGSRSRDGKDDADRGSR
jgi:flagellar biogenesis protein FliO